MSHDFQYEAVDKNQKCFEAYDTGFIMMIRLWKDSVVCVKQTFYIWKYTKPWSIEWRWLECTTPSAEILFPLLSQTATVWFRKNCIFWQQDHHMDHVFHTLTQAVSTVPSYGPGLPHPYSSSFNTTIIWTRSSTPLLKQFQQKHHVDQVFHTLTQAVWQDLKPLQPSGKAWTFHTLHYNLFCM